MAMIRLQWWHDVVAGEPKRHEVATPLRDAITAGRLHQADLLALIEARERDPPETDEAWPAFVDQTAGALAVAAAHALGQNETVAVRAAGTAYGAAGILRNRALAGLPPVPTLLDLGRASLAAARAAAPSTRR